MAAQGIALSPATVSLLRAGLARAEAGLSEMLAVAVRIEVDLMALAPLQAAAPPAGEAGALVVGIYVGFSGDLLGHCLLCLPEGSAAHMAALLLGEGEAPQDLADSALLEVGNILVSGLVNGMADQGGWRIQVSPPSLARDLQEALVGTVLAAAGFATDQVLVVRGRLLAADRAVEGTLLLMPDPTSLQALTGGRDGGA